MTSEQVLAAAAVLGAMSPGKGAAVLVVLGTMSLNKVVAPSTVLEAMSPERAAVLAKMKMKIYVDW